MQKRLVILGGGESGVGTALLAKNKGFSVFLSDKGHLADNYRKQLIDADIPFEEGQHSLDTILEAELVVKSPGIPDSAEVIKAICSRSIRVVSEIEFAYPYSKAKIISITGSNGKTTTATLTHKILCEGGVNVALAGNIGDSFAQRVLNSDVDWYVLELSSFQLDGCYDFRSDIAVITNITPDHLDRYNYDMELYTKSKFRVAANQTNNHWLITTANDRVTSQFLESNTVGSTVVKINNNNLEGDDCAYLSDDKSVIVCRVSDKEVHIPTASLKLKGLHNYANIMDSVLIAMRVGVDCASIIKSVTSFCGVEHRMELVDTIDGVVYINDSKATNVDSTWYALDSMQTPTIWIVGGQDKGNDYTPLLELAANRVKAIVCMGVDNRKIVEAFTGVVQDIYDTHNLNDMFEAVGKVAERGDTVLLSPAAASFDLFANYEDRGKQFKQGVKDKLYK